MTFLDIFKPSGIFSRFRKAKGRQAQNENPSQSTTFAPHYKGQIEAGILEGHIDIQDTAQRSSPWIIRPARNGFSRVQRGYEERYKRLPGTRRGSYVQDDRYRIETVPVYPDFLCDARDSYEFESILAARGQRSHSPYRRDNSIDDVTSGFGRIPSPSSNKTCVKFPWRKKNVQTSTENRLPDSHSSRCMTNSQDLETSFTDFSFGPRNNSFEIIWNPYEYVPYTINGQAGHPDAAVCQGPLNMSRSFGDPRLACKPDDCESVSSLECGDYEGINFWLDGRRHSRRSSLEVFPSHFSFSDESDEAEALEN
ncbi:hypothetical protein F4779DRAFT_505884 [Xylariaceae sp. FL0662B]|nr:hypothetical protein F4779DRAFT_505884 [Xylariaceae sp. FL0662B]